MSRQIITFSNQKGGVGKTTLTREIGIYLAGTKRNTLLVDADPQGNLSKSLSDLTDEGLYGALTNTDYGILSINPHLHLLSGDIHLANLEKSLIGEIDAYTRMRDLLSQFQFQQYDFILIDSPPSLGALTINALTATNFVLIPMKPALYSMQGTNDLMETISKVRKNLNPEIKLLGAVINEFDSIPVITRQIKAEIENSFGELLFATALSKSIKIEEAIARRSGIASLAKAKVKYEIEFIGEEFLSRLEKSVEE